MYSNCSPVWRGGPHQPGGPRQSLLQERITPVHETLETLRRLPAVGLTYVREPLLEELLILAKQQELSQNHECLIKSFFLQLSAPLSVDARQSRDQFLPHGLHDEHFVLQRSRRHCVIRVKLDAAATPS